MPGFFAFMAGAVYRSLTEKWPPAVPGEIIIYFSTPPERFDQFDKAINLINAKKIKINLVTHYDYYEKKQWECFSEKENIANFLKILELIKSGHGEVKI